MIRYNEYNSWHDEVFDFSRAIFSDKKIKQGGSKQALETMRTVYRIYYADKAWRERWGIPDPDKQ